MAPMLIGLTTITISLAIAILWLLSSRPPARAPHRRYHCVSVEPRGGPVCCAQCEALRGGRFLVNVAPALPIPGCTADECTCRYVHHADRRAGSTRRRHDQGLIDPMPLAVDRRLMPDRRHGRSRALA